MPARGFFPSYPWRKTSLRGQSWDRQGLRMQWTGWQMGIVVRALKKAAKWCLGRTGRTSSQREGTLFSFSDHVVVLERAREMRSVLTWLGAAPNGHYQRPVRGVQTFCRWLTSGQAWEARDRPLEGRCQAGAILLDPEPPSQTLSSRSHRVGGFM